MSNPITLKFKEELISRGKYDSKKKIKKDVLLEEILKWNITKKISHDLHLMLYLLAENIIRKYYINREINFQDVITDSYIKLVDTLEKFNINGESKRNKKKEKSEETEFNVDDATHDAIINDVFEIQITSIEELEKKLPNPFAYFTRVVINNIFTICNKFTKNRIAKDRIFIENGEYHIKDEMEMDFENMMKLNKKLRSKKK